MDENRYQSSEVAQMLGITPDTIRYYSNIGVISPINVYLILMPLANYWKSKSQSVYSL